MMDLFTEKYDTFLLLAENDNEYQGLWADFRSAEAEYLKLYRELTTSQQQVLTEFIGRLSELYQREMELIVTE